jgi:3-oxoadipate enol-lactonase
LTRRPHVNWYDDGCGPALVLLNGWTASGSIWPSALRRRLERRFRVIRIDNRGTGYSRTAPAPFTMTRLAGDVVDVLDAVEVEAAVVAGLSMGGMIAQELALRHPERVQHLILVGTQPPSGEHRSSGEFSVGELIAGPAPGEDITAFFRRTWTAMCGPGFLESGGSLDETVRDLVDRVTPRMASIHQVRAVLGWGRPDRLRTLSVPTTVVHGGADPLVPVANGIRLAQLIPGARYVELPQVGHLVHVEAPDALAAVIEGTQTPPPTIT